VKRNNQQNNSHALHYVIFGLLTNVMFTSAVNYQNDVYDLAHLLARASISVWDNPTLFDDAFLEVVADFPAFA